MCIDKSDDIINKYNNACHGTINMKPVDVKSSTYVDHSDEDPKFEVSERVKISTLATSGIHNLVYGLLISMQLPLHVFRKTLQG